MSLIRIIKRGVLISVKSLILERVDCIHTCTCICPDEVGTIKRVCTCSNCTNKLEVLSFQRYSLKDNVISSPFPSVMIFSIVIYPKIFSIRT